MTPDTTRLESALVRMISLLVQGPPWWAIPSVFVLAVTIYLLDIS